MAETLVKPKRKATVSPRLRAACIANAAKARAALKAKLARGENPWKKKRLDVTSSTVEIPLDLIPPAKMVTTPAPKKYKPRVKTEVPVSNADGYADFVAAAWLALQRQKGSK
jgi:hypothetical protein